MALPPFLDGWNVEVGCSVTPHVLFAPGHKGRTSVGGSGVGGARQHDGNETDEA